MQTFLPYADFRASARALDYRRLGKQRLEAGQILEVLRGARQGWRSHPAVKMWSGFENALIEYRNTIIEEWTGRGYRNTLPLLDAGAKIQYPPWLGFEPFHASHRANLLRKLPEHYSRHGWTEDPSLPYYWPAAPRPIAVS